MKYFLATTGISDSWDTDRDILLLGPWCIPAGGDKNIVRGKSYAVVPSPWKNADKIKEAGNYAQSIYKETLPVLAQRLNLLHNVSHDLKYWRVILGPWLFHFIEVLYDRYMRIMNVLEVYPDFITRVVPQEACSLSCRDTHDFLSLGGKVCDDWYNLKLFSFIINCLCPEKAIAIDFKTSNQPNAGKSSISYRKNLLEALKNVYDRLMPGSIVLSDMYNLSFFDILLLEFQLNIRVRKFIPIKPQPVEEKGICGIRDQLIFDNSSSNDFIGLLYKVLPLAIPDTYIEHYKTYKKNAVSGRRVKIAGSAVGWYFNEEFKFFAAEASTNGAKLIEFQHGGGYGMSLSVPAEFIALEKDVFYTWGGGYTDKKAESLPSPHLSRLKNTALLKSDDFLFIGTTTHRYVSSFFSGLLPDDMDKYFNHKNEFFNSLSGQALAKIKYFPYRECGWREKERIGRAFPYMELILNGSLAEKMKKAALVIVDNLSTTFIESLAINVPSIFYWDHDIFAIRPEVEEYFALLHDASILYKDPLSAARKVNEICDDPYRWWGDKKVQKAINIFCDKFAADSADWPKKWAEVLNGN
ncbi:MAG: hypothetical protein A2987_00265 [Omnitrophica bacterium RIFCSPLOWO2_01_FULL_45_10]|nr:MAG: hypothetical protein A2987_00265 [Omnitrophica bacterium RIFCSPLOWO2_01_FULL_45_10]